MRHELEFRLTFKEHLVLQTALTLYVNRLLEEMLFISKHLCAKAEGAAAPGAREASAIEQAAETTETIIREVRALRDKLAEQSKQPSV